MEQFEAASTSIVMNIAEGKGRNSKKELIRDLYIARDSAYETVKLAIIFAQRNWMNKKQLAKVESDALEIA